MFEPEMDSPPISTLPYDVVRTERVRAIREQFVALGPPKRFTLEIGSGHGHFLNAYARAAEDRFCLGIDIVLDRLDRSERKRARAALSNVAFLRAEASEFLVALPEDFSIQEAFILFPDPWPKRRHHKNRLMRPEFLHALAERCVPGAPLYFRTDHSEYFSAAQEVLSAHPRWRPAPTMKWPFELETVFQARATAFHSLIATRV